MSKKSTDRDIAEAAAIASAGAAAGYFARHGFITQKGEFRALLGEKAPLKTLETHPHLKRSIEKMASIPETQRLPGYGTADFFNSRKYVDGKAVIAGEAKLMAHLEKIAPSLGYTDAGMKAPKTSPLKAEKIATIVIGPPAAGKSTIANDLARKGNAAIIDPDVVKKAIPGFNGGVGANAVHEESSALTKKWLKAHTDKGHNVVVPRVGDNPAKLAAGVNELRAAGYKVNVVNVHVPSDVSMTRMLRRFDRTGRLVNPDYVRSIGDKPAKALDHIAKMGIASTSTVDLSHEKPPRPQARGLKAALTGKDPRYLQNLTKIGGRAGVLGIAALGAAKIFEVVTRKNSPDANDDKSPYQKASGEFTEKEYTAAQQENFKSRRKAAV